MKANHRLLALALVVTLGGAAAGAQTFNSGSNGSDGALDLTGQTGTIVFNPASFNPPLDPDHDNVYHFTTIKIPAGLTVRLSEELLGVKPVVWLATGNVSIQGFLDLRGSQGHNYNGTVIPAKAGAGGYAGGIGETASVSWQPGQGPGAARGAQGAAGHVVAGTGAAPGLNGETYGTDFLIPLIGGSGGAGGPIGPLPGSGGGAGGGAILIASSTLILIDGSISVDGGHGGLSDPPYCGGGGSGGSLRLIAPVIDGPSTSASLSARGGGSYNSAAQGSRGRIRLETFQLGFIGMVDPSPSTAKPGLVFPPTSAPAVRITSIGGVAVPANPTASYITPDVTLDDATSVTIQLAASKVPVGTVVHLTLTPETGSIVMVDSTPLAGTFESSTATATVTIPHGFSRFSVQASWTP
jgi:hypothetical protein